ncbi:MAG: hypothetical protein CMJ58_14035 [Planctomycetaceae bacterium]|nr:hypothetical protein [Planctomycetaceae bacterium]
MTRSQVAAATASLVCTLGCSGSPGRVATPQVDPADAAQAAFELYDKNSDDRLDPEELQACPALVDALPVYDADKDGSLTPQETAAGINGWAKRGIGAMALPFTVRLDGRPLQGAKIAVKPVEFLEGYIGPATGASDETGSGTLQMSAEDRPANVPANLPVMQPGLYTVHITHPDVDIPPRYNSSTTLGLEAGIAGQNPSGVTWELSSKK